MGDNTYGPITGAPGILWRVRLLFRRHSRHILILLVSLFAVYASEIRRPTFSDDVEIRHEVNSNFLTLVLGSYGGMVSSMEWVDFIYAYANVLFDQGDPRALPAQARAVADLDTNWAYPRLVAAWIFPQFPQQISKSETIWFLEDGAKRFPKDWQFRITWAQYTLDSPNLNPNLAKDSAAKILLPLSESRTEMPEYVRDLAFTLMHKNGRPDEAMSILLQTYEQVPDPLIRIQFHNKIADLLRRDDVQIGSDSAAFLQAIAWMLNSKQASQIEIAKQVLIRLVQPEHRKFALTEARQLAQQFHAYQKQTSTRR